MQGKCFQQCHLHFVAFAFHIFRTELSLKHNYPYSIRNLCDNRRLDSDREYKRVLGMVFQFPSEL